MTGSAKQKQATDMKYEFKMKVTTFDYWLLSMYNTYHSLVGTVNICFFAAMVILCYRFWNSVGHVLQTFMFLGLLLIPVIHPLGVYLKARAQMMLTPQEAVLYFDEKGMKVILGDKFEFLRYDKLIAMNERCGMVIIYSDGNHGYILTNRVLGKQKQAFLSFLKDKLKKSL